MDEGNSLLTSRQLGMLLWAGMVSPLIRQVPGVMTDLAGGDLVQRIQIRSRKIGSVNEMAKKNEAVVSIGEAKKKALENAVRRRSGRRPQLREICVGQAE